MMISCVLLVTLPKLQNVSFASSPCPSVWPDRATFGTTSSSLNFNIWSHLCPCSELWSKNVWDYFLGNFWNHIGYVKFQHLVTRMSMPGTYLDRDGDVMGRDDDNVNVSRHSDARRRVVEVLLERGQERLLRVQHHEEERWRIQFDFLRRFSFREMASRSFTDGRDAFFG